MEKSKTKSLFNKSELRKFVLEASSHRTMGNGEPRFTRISPAFITLLEHKLKEMIRGHVHHQPSLGRTL